MWRGHISTGSHEGSSRVSPSVRPNTARARARMSMQLRTISLMWSVSRQRPAPLAWHGDSLVSGLTPRQSPLHRVFNSKNSMFRMPDGLQASHE